VKRAGLREIESPKRVSTGQLENLRGAALADQLGDALVPRFEHRRAERELVRLQRVLPHDLRECFVRTDQRRHLSGERNVRELAIVG